MMWHMNWLIMLQENIARICRKSQGSLDAAIQNKKEFRNPSIYDKLLSHVGLNEKGTNYPPVSKQSDRHVFSWELFPLVTAISMCVSQ